MNAIRALALPLSLLGLSLQPVPAQMKVGTFDSRAVAIAYAQSPAFGEQMKQTRADFEKARSEKNESLSKQLAERGMTQQRLLHLQGFSTCSVSEILALFPDAVAAVAKERGVDLIVSQYEVQFKAGTVETVDITETLVTKINNSQRVLGMLSEMKKQKPLGLMEALALPVDR